MFSKIEKELIEIDSNILENFEGKCRNGESKSNLSNLIQKYSVDVILFLIR